MHSILVIVLFIFSIFHSTSINANPQPPVKRIIYITFDGVRWQDIYKDKSHFPILWNKYAKDLQFYGMPGSDTTMKVASVAISLPSYQSQMSGCIQPCFCNSCGRITVETFPEKLIHALGFQKRDVATFSSWWHINFAVEHISDTTFANTGNLPVYNPDTGKPDEVMAWLNKQQEQDHPRKERFPNSRYDKYTYAQAIHYFETFQPRFLWISFVESDEAAHLNDLPYYHMTLEYYDLVLDDLFTKLKAMKLDKTTMVIVTTDHGRGNGIFWTDHGPHLPESSQTWAFVFNGQLKPHNISKPRHFSTLSIRPTVEAFLKDDVTI